nr:unnamed protein product [Digitaria exilis]
MGPPLHLLPNGRLTAALLLLAACLSACNVQAVTSAEASFIAHRQLIAMKEAGGGESGDLPADFEFDDRVGANFPNPRLRRAYIALQAWRRAFYSDPKGYTSNWVGNDVCKYNGVVCVEALDDPKIMVVAGIDLNGADIAGYLPPELGLLTDLAFFHINTNRFCGIIPKSMSRLSLLHEFDVSNNRFVGPFPFVCLEMASLKYLDIRFNDFEGELPPGLFDKDLDAIFVNTNRFVGHIPENLGNSTASVIVFANNGLIGCIPKSIGRMVKTLDEIIFMNNKLEGCLPLEMGYLQNTTQECVCWLPDTRSWTAGEAAGGQGATGAGGVTRATIAAIDNSGCEATAGGAAARCSAAAERRLAPGVTGAPQGATATGGASGERKPTTGAGDIYSSDDTTGEIDSSANSGEAYSTTGDSRKPASGASEAFYSSTGTSGSTATTCKGSTGTGGSTATTGEGSTGANKAIYSSAGTSGSTATTCKGSSYTSSAGCLATTAGEVSTTTSSSELATTS